MHIRFRRDKLKAIHLMAGASEPGEMETLVTLTKRIAELAPKARFSEGIDLLFSEEPLAGVTFRSARDYENYLFWQLLLHAGIERSLEKTQ